MARMHHGLSVQRIDSDIGKLEGMELHSTPSQHNGGLLDARPILPDEYAFIDTFRNLGGSYHGGF